VKRTNNAERGNIIMFSISGENLSVGGGFLARGKSKSEKKEKG